MGYLDIFKKKSDDGIEYSSCSVLNVFSAEPTNRSSKGRSLEESHSCDRKFERGEGASSGYRLVEIVPIFNRCLYGGSYCW